MSDTPDQVAPIDPAKAAAAQAQYEAERAKVRAATLAAWKAAGAAMVEGLGG